MKRRTLLKYMAGAAVACPTCLSVASAFAGETKPAAGSGGHASAARWGYSGDDGPKNWGDISPAYTACSGGVQQSPINLQGSVSARLDDVQVNYADTSLNVVNNGHTIQINTDPGSSIQLGGETYDLLQFHFHHPSEHLLSGKPYEMEAHYVHASKSGGLAVLGVFIGLGAVNSLLTPVWAAMPREAGQKSQSNTRINPEQLLPTNRQLFRYYGSLTTPPCSEKVIWSLYSTPVEASRRQIRQFADIFPMNARPVQGLNRRMLLKSL